MAIPIIFNMINVNALDTNASINIGETQQSGWNAHSKNNFGNGMTFGNVATIGNCMFFSDNDIIDSPIADPDIVQPNQLETL